MDRAEDPFIALASEMPANDFASLKRRSVSPSAGTRLPLLGLPAVLARLHGFDLLDQPIVSDVSGCSGQLLVARTTVQLRGSMVGSDVVVLLDGADHQVPIIIGVIEPAARSEPCATLKPIVSVEADGERHVIEAEREIVLRCGDASITLTRAGKVIIRGNYILSRSTGYNKIKGAAIDIN
jgi:hypothetical protein